MELPKGFQIPSRVASFPSQLFELGNVGIDFAIVHT